MCINRAGCKYLTRDLFECFANDRAGKLNRFVRIHVCQRNMHFALTVNRCGTWNWGYFAVAECIILTFEIAFQKPCLLVNPEHPEHMISWSKHHFLLLCQDNRLKHVHHLGKVSHLNPFSMFIEDIKMYCCRKGVPQCVLLVQESWIRARLNIVPVTPFVDYQSFRLSRIVAVHYCLMTSYYLIHLKVSLHRFEPGVLVKLCGWSFRPAPTVGNRIVMDWQSLESSPWVRILHKGLGPCHVVVRRSACNPVKPVTTIVIQVGGELPHYIGIELGGHISPASPVLISYSPVLYLPGSLAPVFLAESCHRTVGIGGKVFYPFSHLPDSTRANIAVDVSIAVEKLA